MSSPAPSAAIGPVNFDVSVWSDTDTYLYKEGSHFELYGKMGAHPMVDANGNLGTYFSVWAPNAVEVHVVGDFNGWDGQQHRLGVRPDGTGVWEGFIPGIGKGTLYKYRIFGHNGFYREKQDPYAFHGECPPKTASVVWDLDYEWNDADWMQTRAKNNDLHAPWSVYEVHLGSWRRAPEDGGRSLSYREIAPALAHYCQELGFTHIELLPIMEHPFYPSWGYQVTGYFAPTARFGTPQDFMFLVDTLHQAGIGVILDWVPSHFASDDFALQLFDGTHLYEHADPRKGYHPDWGSYIFNYDRNEVRAFLISNARYWLDKYHIDGLRIDAVASMLYLDYSRQDGEWLPNIHGGNENLGAISFLRRMNEAVYEAFPDVQTIAEESTAFPMVSRPSYLGGLGFGMKWNMGWMHDTLYFMQRDPVHRKYHHHSLTFSLLYAFTENFMLPFSHDEVVHLKGSLLAKMPGANSWEKFANLRLMLGYMWMHPGQKLLFMGGEFGQGREWDHDTSLDWHQLEIPYHAQVKWWVSNLNRIFKNNPALHVNFSAEGFYWVDFCDWESSVVSFVRKSADGKHLLLCALNFTPVPRLNYRVGTPADGYWEEVLNSDALEFGGSGHGNFGGVEAHSQWAYQGQPHSMEISLPPLSCVAFYRSLSPDSAEGGEAIEVEV